MTLDSNAMNSNAMNRNALGGLLRRLVLAVAAVLAVAVPALAQTYAVTDGRTAAGIRLVHLRIERDPNQVFAFLMEDRYALTTPGRAGVAALGPRQLLLGGAGDLDGGAVEEELKDIRASIAFRSGPLYTTGEVSAPAENADQAMAWLGRIVTAPRFAEPALRRARRGLIEQIRQGREEADELASLILYRSIIDDPALLTLRTNEPIAAIEQVDRAAIAAWHKAVFARSNLTVVAAGPLDREAAAALVDKAFGALPAEPQLNARPTFDLTARDRVIVLEKPVAQSVILIGGVVPFEPERDGPLRSVAIDVLGGAQGSRLFAAIRERLGASYGAGASADVLHDRTYLLAMQASVANDRVADALAAFRSEYERFREQGLTQEELDSRRSRTLTNFRDAMTRAGSAASTIRSGLLLELGPDLVNRQDSRFGAVTLPGVNAFIAAKLPQAWTTVIVTPSAAGLGATCVIKAVAELAACR
jgi:zinc protease